MSWTPGKIQAERYSLEKHYDSIRYERDTTFRGTTGKDHYQIWATPKGDLEQGKDLGLFAPEQLPGVVGKELAEKIIAGEGRPYTTAALQSLKSRGMPTDVFSYPDDPGSWYIRYSSGKEMGIWPTRESALRDVERQKEMISMTESGREFRGLDLKVGGEGLKRIYDEMLPRKANEIGKRLGVKVGTTVLDTADSPSSPLYHGVDSITAPSISLTPAAKSELMKPQNWLSIGPLGLTAMLAAQIDKANKREKK